jgi:hypothetical protein
VRGWSNIGDTSGNVIMKSNHFLPRYQVILTKNSMTLFRGIVLGLLMLRSLSAEAQGPSLALQPATQNISKGSSATVQVAINGVQALHAYSVRIAYDPLRLRCLSVRGKTFLGSSTLFFPNLDSIAGKVGADEAILGTGGVSGTGALLELVFEGLQSGTSALHLVTTDLRDATNTPITVQAQDGEIRVGEINSVTSTILEDSGELQAVCYPNPFNSSTRLNVRSGNGTAVVSIYSLLGVEVLHREVQTRRGETLTINWNGCDQAGRTLAGGVYFFRVTFAGTSACTRIMLLK